jgi:RNA polymerase-binding transcription factor DksA
MIAEGTMTQAEIKSYRVRLLALKRRLGGVLTDLEEEALRPVGGEAAGGLSDVPVHPADLGTENYEEEVSLGLLENEIQLLTEVNDALRRIEQGTFGRCEECHQPISRARLNALPYARYCLRCARKLQGSVKNERQF